MDFNYYAQIESIAPRPVLFIVGTEAATVFMSKAGYEKAKQPKEWFDVPGATHHRLYDDEAAVGKAVAKLEEFFERNLKRVPSQIRAGRVVINNMTDDPQAPWEGSSTPASTANMAGTGSRRL